MVVRVRLFAILRERAGTGELSLELPEGARAADVIGRLEELAPGVPLVLAVNREYAAAEQPLSDGDELAAIPPVSGGDATAGPGAASAAHAAVRDGPLSLDDLVARVRDPRAGAVVTFQGVTREVDRLEYEAYREMAEPQLAGIAREAIERHGLCAAAVEHRVGSVALGEASVAVAASAPHREEAFAGARAIIDAVKARAPIWKREVDGGRERWVRGSSPRP